VEVSLVLAFDLIVIGLGAMGSSAAYYASLRGARVLGLEQFSPLHDRGSSHGDVRLIRKAYFEEPRYVPLLQTAYRLWDELGSRLPSPVLHRTGLLTVAPQSDAPGLVGALRAAAEHHLPIEKLDTTEIRQRFPHFTIPDPFQGVRDADGGYVEVERTLRELTQFSIAQSATLNFNERVLSWTYEKRVARVVTDRGTYEGASLLLAGGSWSSQLLRTLGLPLTVCRIPQFWFDAPDTYSEASGFGCFAFDLPEGFYYGFPQRAGLGLKVAEYRPPGAEIESPDVVDRGVTSTDARRVQAFVGKYLPAVNAESWRGKTCLYTLSPDENFIIDRLDSGLVFAAGFSGHGFKFAPVVGEYLADLALGGLPRPEFDFLKRRPWKKNG
jgi:sarcosine oxidase